MKPVKLVAGVVACACLIAGSAQAQETGTLKKIKETKTITLGVRDTSVPFSYLDNKQAYHGYSINICEKIATSIQRQLGLAALDIKMASVTPATRIPMILNGSIDLECGNTTNNLERQKQVAFAPTTFVTTTRLLAKKSSGIKTLADMKGKPIVSTSGSSNLKLIAALNNDRNLGMTVIEAKDNAEAFAMLESGRAMAFAMDDIILASLASNAKTPGDYAITGEALSVEPYGIMLRRDDPEFKQAVDRVVTDLFKSGEINRIYFKWFQLPIPPKNIVLGWPLTDQVKGVFLKPTDSGDPAVYSMK